MKPTSENQGAQCGLRVKAIDFLFTKFSLNYGHAWTSQLKSEKWEAALKRHWYEKLKSLPLQEIYQALRFLESLNNTEHKKFPPTVLEFLDLPRQLKLKRIPSDEECYSAAIRSDWQFHELVYPVAIACDIYWLQHQASEFEARKKFNFYFKILLEKYVRGESIAVEPALPKPKKTAVLSVGERFHLEVLAKAKDLQNRAKPLF